MDPSCLVSAVQAAAGGVMVWGIFSWHTLGPLVPTEHRLNTTAYLSIVADHVHPFMTTVYHLLMAAFSRITRRGIMDMQPTNLQHLHDAIMSIWSRTSEECFQHLVESTPQRIQAVLKAKGGPKCPVHMCVCVCVFLC